MRAGNVTCGTTSFKAMSTHLVTVFDERALETDEQDWELDPASAPSDGNGVVVSDIEHGIGYIDSLRAQSGLHLLQGDAGRYAYRTIGDYGLFLIFHIDVFESTAQVDEHVPRTDESNKRKRSRHFRWASTCNVYCILSRMKDYWSRIELKGHTFFNRIMSRDNFFEIRSYVVFFSQRSAGPSAEDKQKGPLWH